MQHILSARQFEPAQLEDIFAKAQFMEELTQSNPQYLVARHLGKQATTLFYEPSTRTRLSFGVAAQRLGIGLTSTENAKEFSSAAKGETLEDTIQTVARYVDAVVLRHHETGAADRAAALNVVPIINAGDGKGQHPTQALLDLYTIKKEKGRTDNLNVVIGGDLKQGRTARSLAQMLSLYDGNSLTFVSTDELKMGSDITDHLHQTGTNYSETDDMHAAVRDADVVYWTRLQKERSEGGNDPQSHFVIDQSVLQSMSDGAIIMHPLPRVGEIEPSVDTDPRAKYFGQVENGLWIRMALFDDILAAA